MIRFNLTTGLLIITAVLIKAQYISEVLEYLPAPGQHINSSPWGVPASANSIAGGVNGSMSLGAFGGYVIFRFENPVENHPDNPYGIDFTIFGNPLTDRSEPGIVSVMKDENGNGQPDDTWYELAGSDHFFSSAIKNYEVTYSNPKKDTAANISWSDNQGHSGLIYANSFHTQPYYPLADSFPSVGTDSYTLSGTRIKDAVDTSNPAFILSYKRAFGYADNQLRGSAPYTVPDNPYTPGIENSGADAFDIDWAVNDEGEYIDIDEIHFIRVHTGVQANSSWLGEISTEITGAADVSPDNTITGVLDMVVIKDLPEEIDTPEFQMEVFVFHKGRLQHDKLINWTSNMEEASVDANNILSVTKSGELILTASLADKPGITATASTIVKYVEPASVVNNNKKLSCRLYPNPAKDYLKIEGVHKSDVLIINAAGIVMLYLENYNEGENIDITRFPEGFYIAKIMSGHDFAASGFIKE